MNYDKLKEYIQSKYDIFHVQGEHFYKLRDSVSHLEKIALAEFCEELLQKIDDFEDEAKT